MNNPPSQYGVEEKGVRDSEADPQTPLRLSLNSVLRYIKQTCNNVTVNSAFACDIPSLSPLVFSLFLFCNGVVIVVVVYSNSDNRVAEPNRRTSRSSSLSVFSSNQLLPLRNETESSCQSSRHLRAQEVLRAFAAIAPFYRVFSLIRGFLFRLIVDFPSDFVLNCSDLVEFDGFFFFSFLFWDLVSGEFCVCWGLFFIFGGSVSA